MRHDKCGNVKTIIQAYLRIRATLLKDSAKRKNNILSMIHPELKIYECIDSVK